MKPEDIHLLAGALLELPSLKDLHLRNDVVDELPPAIRNSIKRRTQLKPDVIQVIKTCAAHQNGIAKLFAVLGEYEGQSSIPYHNAWQVWQKIKQQKSTLALAGPSNESGALPPRFRNLALKSLSVEAVKKMIRKHNFFEINWNETGKGIIHQYELKQLKDDKIVLDHVAGLIWEQSGSLDQRNYQNARKYVIDLNRKQFAGFNDWRLPTLEEGMSLMKPVQSRNGLHIDEHFDAKQDWIWTADRHNSSEFWQINFINGDCYPGHQNDRFYVRAVRPI